jgi:hypothetical protein
MKTNLFNVRRLVVVGVAAGALGVSAAAQARPIIPLGDDGPPVVVPAQTRSADGVGRSTTNLAHDNSDAFAWGDFGVGIGAAAGVMLATVGIALLARNRRRLATLH